MKEYTADAEFETPDTVVQVIVDIVTSIDGRTFVRAGRETTTFAVDPGGSRLE